MATVDQGGAIRPGEELDVAAVDRWLKQQDGTLTGQPNVTQYSGGASNWTYRLEYPHRDLILRRPPAGTKAAGAHDMAREYFIQTRLKQAYPAVPATVALCQDTSVIGCDFYVMERIAGIIPRANLPRELDFTAPRVRELCLNVLDQLIALHQVDYRAAGLESLGKGAGYCRRQVEGWSGRYEKSLTWNVPRFRKVRAWLQAHVPEDSRTCVIHNDWRFDNVVLSAQEPTRVIGVLDWELATLGDPLMDLGSMLAYWVQADDNAVMRAARRQPTHLPGMLTRREVVDYYLAKTGLTVDNWVFYEVFGLFRLAVIAQQIYYRYHHGQTRNPAFKHFWLMVHALYWRCRRLIRQSQRR
ncbi:phosphotransferase family protein [Pseudothauera nasutitermitis]|uniref:Phosphotransferase family protein n=1 Tax=Pseudothauera nasutitermitis TaxID=2565930 RepID=A0A4S4B1U8_9RHOO|nr:phosphotransferase family protein [Pseudothauera nasutitermitis]THF66544.1 phosphotransferase family protein [Pseudothauera nasutitermitis]